jgi:NADH dehydrogenase FAD-containing subunit
VELAAEIAHFFPRLSVTLVDGAPKVLPQLAEPAQGYARQWLQQHGVQLKLGEPFSVDSVADGQQVLWCVGARPRNKGFFADPSVLTARGQIRVNRRMQVIRSLEPAADQSGKAVEYEAVGQGRVYAVGDAVAVEGVPMAQMIFHGEEMAAIAVSGIEAREDVASPFAFSKTKREAEPEGLPLLCCTSLGPQDGMFSTQTELLATGTLAALQKQMIEDTKLGALKGELLSSALWSQIH